MNISNKKGLTLVELIAVLIIIIIIFLTAVSKVNDIMDMSEKKSIKGDALSYAKATNDLFTLENGVSPNKILEGLYSYDELKDMGVKVSGTKPDDGYLLSINNSIRYGCLQYKKRKAIIENNNVTNVTLGKCKLNENGYNKDLDSYLYKYTGSEKVLTITKSGSYLIEAWGGQGGDAIEGYIGGYGGYSKGYVDLNADDILYINVGGAGQTNCVSVTCAGGYNGGGNGVPYTRDSNNHVAGGGGATSITLNTGLLSSFSDGLNDIIIVAGGGGGAYYHTNGASHSSNGGAGGGFEGTTQCNENTSYSCPTAGSQKFSGAAGSGGGSGSFGKGGAGSSYSSGGGAGLYGGGGSYHKGTGGGSGYIANKYLYNKIMYCYNCTESDYDAYKTKSTTCASDTPKTNCSKKGSGFVRIIYVGEASSGSSAGVPSYSPSSQEYAFRNSPYRYIAPKNGTYKVELWGAQGGKGSYFGTVPEGGYGGYSTGTITLTKGETIFLFVGGQGQSVPGNDTPSASGYNGGGRGSKNNGGAGGGATDIRLVYNGSNDNTSLQSRVIVASGGGGSVVDAIGGNGGGILGNNGTISGATTAEHAKGGSQTAGGNEYLGVYDPESGEFGLGGNANWDFGAGGGGGYYGGGGGGASHSWSASGGGGSGYIGHSRITNGVMYCYECTESTESSTQTISTTCVSETPTSNCAKKGNGYLKISFIE